MTGTQASLDFIEKPLTSVKVNACAIFGSERFLKRLALKKILEAVAAGDPEFSPETFDSETTEWRDVHDALTTRSLFGGDQARVVVIDHADKFVSSHRERIEDWIATAESKSKSKSKPSSDKPADSLLILIVDSWVATTRLYKAINTSGLQVCCDAPLRGNSKSRDDQKIAKWLVHRARKEYEFDLPITGAQLVIDATDCDFGRMDQELQKLELYVDAKQKLSTDSIQHAVGGWRTRTMWDAIDAAVDGKAGYALDLLDQLFRSGEHPLALFGQLSWSLRRYATATEIVWRQMRNRQRTDLKNALIEAGFRNQVSELATAEKRLKQLTSKRAGHMAQWLVETDLALKRSHSHASRGRGVLEELIVKMAKELSPHG